MLTCRGLTRRPWFERRDLELGAGEIAVLRGPSGSGKSLFLRAIADLDPVDAGSVALGSVERSSMPASKWRARVLYVHPGGVKIGETVGTDLARVRGLALHTGRDASAAQPALGLAEDADTRRLSSGEAQTLALFRALECAPDVLLLDEPTSSLDASAAAVWERRLREWVAAGERAALWITHDAELAGRIGAREERFP